MSRHHHPSSFKFTPNHLVRLVIFSIVFYLLVNYLSSRRPLTISSLNDPTVLGEETINSIYNLLPENSKTSLRNLNQSHVIIYLQDKYKYIQDQLSNFPAKQIKELQKAAIDRIYQDIINSLETKK